MGSDDSSSRSATRIEDTVLGSGGRRYRQFIRVLLGGLIIVLALDALWLVTDALGISAISSAVVDGLWLLTATILTLFLLTGLLQFLVLGRAFERSTEEVAQSASELEQTAEEVVEAAEEVEKLTDAVATQPERDEQVADVKEQANEIKDEMESVERTATETKDALREQKTMSDDESDAGKR